MKRNGNLSRLYAEPETGRYPRVADVLFTIFQACSGSEIPSDRGSGRGPDRPNKRKKRVFGPSVKRERDVRCDGQQQKQAAKTDQKPIIERQTEEPAAVPPDFLRSEPLPAEVRVQDEPQEILNNPEDVVGADDAELVAPGPGRVPEEGQVKGEEDEAERPDVIIPIRDGDSNSADTGSASSSWGIRKCVATIRSGRKRRT